MAKDYGFRVTREREARRRWSSLRWVWAAALAALVWILGLTRAWSQSSGSSLSGSGNDLTRWETLSSQFQTALKGQSETLRKALTEMESSKASSLKLTGLLEESLTANERLRNYNAQIAERMQARDEDLAAAYGEIERLRKQRVKLIITVVSLCVLIAAAVGIQIVLRRL